MKMSTCALLCTISAAIVGSANAGIINTGIFVAGIQDVDKPLFSAAGTTDRANLASSGAVKRSQGFSVTSPIVLDSVSILAESVMTGAQTMGDTVTLYITNGLGGAGDSVLFSQTYDVTADAAGAPTWHSFNLGVVLDTPGEYFLVIGSNGAMGFKVRQVGPTNTSGLSGRGFLQSPAGDPVADNSGWFFFGSNVLATQFYGSAIPAPGSLALVAVSGLLIVPRRKR
jgi:hypothetical protein